MSHFVNPKLQLLSGNPFPPQAFPPSAQHTSKCGREASYMRIARKWSAPGIYLRSIGLISRAQELDLFFLHNSYMHVNKVNFVFILSLLQTLLSMNEDITFWFCFHAKHNSSHRLISLWWIQYKWAKRRCLWNAYVIDLW